MIEQSLRYTICYLFLFLARLRILFALRLHPRLTMSRDPATGSLCRHCTLRCYRNNQPAASVLAPAAAFCFCRELLIVGSVLQRKWCRRPVRSLFQKKSTMLKFL